MLTLGVLWGFADFPLCSSGQTALWCPQASSGTGETYPWLQSTVAELFGSANDNPWWWWSCCWVLNWSLLGTCDCDSSCTQGQHTAAHFCSIAPDINTWLEMNCVLCKAFIRWCFFQSTFQVVICSKAPLSGSLAGFCNFCTCWKWGKRLNSRMCYRKLMLRLPKLTGAMQWQWCSAAVRSSEGFPAAGHAGCLRPLCSQLCEGSPWSPGLRGRRLSQAMHQQPPAVAVVLWEPSQAAGTGSIIWSSLVNECQGEAALDPCWQPRAEAACCSGQRLAPWFLSAIVTKTPHKSCTVFGVLMKNALTPKSDNTACVVLRRKKKGIGKLNNINNWSCCFPSLSKELCGSSRKLLIQQKV